MTRVPMAHISRVLLVNDEKRLRDSWSWLLTRRGYTPMTAESGQSAIGILATEPPDVVLLDLKMPVIEGRAVLDIIAKEY